MKTSSSPPGNDRVARDRRGFGEAGAPADGTCSPRVPGAPYAGLVMRRGLRWGIAATEAAPLPHRMRSLRIPEVRVVCFGTIE